VICGLAPSPAPVAVVEIGIATVAAPTILVTALITG